MITQVVHVGTDTDEGYLAVITVRRMPTRTFQPLPRIEDVPPDVRDALQIWLDGEQR